MPDLEARASYAFDLPEAQIAATPAERREASRLLVVDEALQHKRFAEVRDELREGDLLVVNEVRVRPCRLEARKETGGRVELLVLGREGEHVRCMFKTRRSLRVGQSLALVRDGEPSGAVVVEALCGGGQLLLSGMGDLDALMEAAGAMPLPPYIVKRREHLGMDAELAMDRERYQTVYARTGFAVAAPTAGLHFSEALLASLAERGVGRAAVSLDVGIGTFTPIRGERLSEHTMHAERYRIERPLIDAMAECRARGGRVVAVGTTVVRALEDQMQRYGELCEGVHEASLFIKPGFAFRAIDGLITNFHLPGSTLLVLVSALGGYERMMEAYRVAVAEGYRFYSYGDAMLIWPRGS